MTKKTHLLAREGLLRLRQAVLHPTPRMEHSAARERRIRMCLAWGPHDTATTILERHPHLAESPSQLHRRMQALRLHIPGIRKGAHMCPQRIAQRYLDAVYTPMIH